MSRRDVLVDAGPLVAFLNRNDSFHEWAKQALGKIEAPLVTCEAVVSEACFLLGKHVGGSKAIFSLLDGGLLVLPFRLEDERAAVGRLMARYQSVPMSLADACLVRMLELGQGRAVLTLDADFFVYRSHGRRAIPVIGPTRGKGKKR